MNHEWSPCGGTPQDILTPRQMAEVDRRAQEELGIPGVVLMECAGRAVWQEVCRRVPAGRGVICAGPGNNGGDALVVARYARMAATCAEEAPVILTSRAALGGMAAAQWEILERMGASRCVWEEDPGGCADVLRRAPWVLDGILGNGLAGAPRGAEAELMSELAGMAVPVYAVDVPSGVAGRCPADQLVVPATVTISTGPPRRSIFCGAVRRYAGEIITVDPGFPRELVRAVSRDDPAHLTPPEELLRSFLRETPVNPDSHKGTRGALGILGGGDGATGAPVLAALAGLSGGAGVVRVVSGDPRGQFAPIHPAVMITREDAAAREALVERSAVVVAGPGWIHGDGDALAAVLEHCAARGVPVVLDAAALRIVARWINSALPPAVAEALHRVPVVLTPHPGEMAALAGTTVAAVQEDPLVVIRRVQERIPAVIVLKDSVTWIAAPGDTPARAAPVPAVVVDGRCPALGTAGSGDVLAGLAGAFLARCGGGGGGYGGGGTPQGPSRVETGCGVMGAVCAAAAAHLLAGRRLFHEIGWFDAQQLAAAVAREAAHGP